MMKRFKAKPGDIFKVPIGNQIYFIQYLMDDDTLFRSNIIRAFDHIINLGDPINLIDIIDKPIKFITHTYIKSGIKLNVWEKAGNIQIEKDFIPPIFRATNDVYSEVKKSKNWFVWKAGEREKKIGRLTNNYKNLPYGSVHHPMDIVEWIKTGNHGFMRPE